MTTRTPHRDDRPEELVDAIVDLVDAIRESVARTLWVSHYADAVEDGEYDGPRAGPGEDWFDVAPDAPSERLANGLAMSLIVGAHANANHTAAHYLRWTEYTTGDGTPERYGHCLAMQAMGHGVGLWDDWPYGRERPEIRLPEFAQHLSIEDFTEQ